MKSKVIVATLGTLAALTATASVTQAADFDYSKYYTVTQVRTQEVPTPPALEMNATPAPFAAPDTAIDIGGVSIDEIINLGKEIWQVIQDNKPVVNVSTDHANALPKGINDWQSLAGWQAPQARTFQTTFTNAYGMDVVVFEYRLTYTAGGNYRGHGKYLANVTVVPSNLTVAWGYKFNAQVSIPSLTNAGSVQSPLAAAELLVKWSVDTILSHSEQSAGYYVRGDGAFTALQ